MPVVRPSRDQARDLDPSAWSGLSFRRDFEQDRWQDSQRTGARTRRALSDVTSRNVGLRRAPEVASDDDREHVDTRSYGRREAAAAASIPAELDLATGRRRERRPRLPVR